MRSLILFALVLIGCDNTFPPVDFRDVDGGMPVVHGQFISPPPSFDRTMPPGSECDPTETCTFDGPPHSQCAAPDPAPANARFAIGCCVRANICPNAGLNGVCAFEVAIRLTDPKGPALTFCVDCGDGRGLRCGL